MRMQIHIHNLMLRTARSAEYEIVNSRTLAGVKNDLSGPTLSGGGQKTNFRRGTLE
jgi:hypothetical protein